MLDAEHIQDVRKSIRKDYCLTHKFDQNPSPKQESFAYIFVDDKFQFIDRAIAKVASTKMKTIFAQLYNKTWTGKTRKYNVIDEGDIKEPTL